MGKLQDINSAENVAIMRDMKRIIEKAVIPFRERVEAAIVAGACLQVAKTLLDLYPEGTREKLIEGGCLLLEGYTGEDSEGPNEKIIIPKWPEFQTLDGSALKKGTKH